MLTAPALPKSAGRRLLTSEFDHRFYRREGDMLGEFAVDAEQIHSASMAGFWVNRAWLDPGKIPAVSGCLAEILASRRPTSRRRKV